MAEGAYIIWTADASGNPLNPPEDDKPEAAPNLMDDGAVDIYFGISAKITQQLPKEQTELQGEIAKVVRALRQLYCAPGGTIEERAKTRFRNYYVRLFRLAQVGLEGVNAMPDIAKSALIAVTADLIDDETGRIKNGHLIQLGKAAGLLSVPILVAYVVLRLSADTPLATFLASVGVDRILLSNFMTLWLGCFLGVWLSYGIRTSVFSLADLTVTDSDRLLPVVRLVFAGCLTMIIGTMCALGIIQVSLGNYSLTNLSENPMLAFLVGVLCGISELALPATVAKKAGELVGKLK